jgi:hypothetical protein
MDSLMLCNSEFQSAILCIITSGHRSPMRLLEAVWLVTVALKVFRLSTESLSPDRTKVRSRGYFCLVFGSFRNLTSWVIHFCQWSDGCIIAWLNWNAALKIFQSMSAFCGSCQSLMHISNYRNYTPPLSSLALLTCTHQTCPLEFILHFTFPPAPSGPGLGWIPDRPSTSAVPNYAQVVIRLSNVLSKTLISIFHWIPFDLFPWYALFCSQKATSRNEVMLPWALILLSALLKANVLLTDTNCFI